LSVKNWIMFTTLGLIWGSSFMWIKIALAEIGPFTLVLLRVFFAAVGVLVVLVVRRVKLPKLRDWGVFVVLGVVNVALPFVFISWSETNISSGLAAILNATMPLFTILIAAVFVPDDRITLAKIVGLVVGFAGVVLLMSNRMDGAANGYLLGILAMLLGAFCYAAGSVYARMKTKGMAVEAQSVGQLSMAFAAMLPATLITESPLRLPQLPITWVAVLWLGLLGSCLATLFYFSLLHSVGPTRTALVTYIFPLVGVVLGAIFLQEVLDWRLAVGGLMILSGIIIVNQRFSLPWARKG
jgi:drug/metabolite transporter (DMT)-like permease